MTSNLHKKSKTAQNIGFSTLNINDSKTAPNVDFSNQSDHTEIEINVQPQAFHAKHTSYEIGTQS